MHTHSHTHTLTYIHAHTYARMSHTHLRDAQHRVSSCLARETARTPAEGGRVLEARRDSPVTMVHPPVVGRSRGSWEARAASARNQVHARTSAPLGFRTEGPADELRRPLRSGDVVSCRSGRCADEAGVAVVAREEAGAFMRAHSGQRAWGNRRWRLSTGGLHAFLTLPPGCALRGETQPPYICVCLSVYVHI